MEISMKNVVVFGTGKYFENYMDCYENETELKNLFERANKK